MIYKCCRVRPLPAASCSTALDFILGLGTIKDMQGIASQCCQTKLGTLMVMERSQPES